MTRRRLLRWGLGWLETDRNAATPDRMNFDENGKWMEMRQNDQLRGKLSHLDAELHSFLLICVDSLRMVFIIRGNSSVFPPCEASGKDRNTGNCWTFLSSSDTLTPGIQPCETALTLLILSWGEPSYLMSAPRPVAAKCLNLATIRLKATRP